MELQFCIINQLQSFAKVYLIFGKISLPEVPLNEAEMSYSLKQLVNNDIVIINRYNELIIVAYADALKEKYALTEQCRIKGNEIAGLLQKEKITEIDIVVPTGHHETGIAFAEGLSLGSYQFLKYQSGKEKNTSNLRKISFIGANISETAVDLLSIMVESVFMARDLVNEPVSHLNAIKLAESFESMGKEAGFSTTIFHKDKIEALKMGGLYEM